MGLSLSSWAVPELGLGELERERRGRGLDGIELYVPGGVSPTALVGEAEAAGVRVLALRADALAPDAAAALAEAAARLKVPLSIPAEQAVERLSQLAELFAGQGARLLLGVGSQLEEVVACCEAIRAAAPDGTLGIAWEIRPSSEDLEDASAVLFAARELLGLVRLHGGGPEQRDQDGLGVGQILTDLALSRYGGPIVLQPSSPEARPRWARWLGSRKSAGCGTRVQEDHLELDVRDVEPRDRLGTILGAYASLGRGKTLRLTVDHDPSCMYYTLEASEPEGSFSFRKTEDGPEVWRAEVTRL